MTRTPALEDNLPMPRMASTPHMGITHRTGTVMGIQNAASRAIHMGRWQAAERGGPWEAGVGGGSDYADYGACKAKTES